MNPLVQEEKIIKMQRWWRSYSSIKNLNTVKNYLLNNLAAADLQDLSNKCHSISKTCSGDGAGLSGGTLKSSIALDWSKNEKDGNREHFSENLFIINLKSEQWWKNKPIESKSKIKVKYNDVIPVGIFLIDKQFCKYYVKLTKNNKTDTLIESQYLYIMLKRSMALKLYIELPSPNKDLTFNILNAFFTELPTCL